MKEVTTISMTDSIIITQEHKRLLKQPITPLYDDSEAIYFIYYSKSDIVNIYTDHSRK